MSSSTTATTMSESKTAAVTIPSEFYCALTHKLMVHPMVSRYGIYYEKSAILKWLEDGNSYCPITKKPLRVNNLVSDKNLEWKINYFCSKNKIERPALPEDEADDDEDGPTGNASAVARAVITVTPKHFTCPLTGEVMEDPVMTKTGVNYERAAILKHLDDVGDFCPVTHKPLAPSQIVSNNKLKWEIQQFELYHGDSTKYLSPLEYESKIAKAQAISSNVPLSQLLMSAHVQDVNNPDALTLKKKSNGDDDAKTATDLSGLLDDVLGTLDD